MRPFFYENVEFFVESLLTAKKITVEDAMCILDIARDKTDSLTKQIPDRMIKVIFSNYKDLSEKFTEELKWSTAHQRIMIRGNINLLGLQR